MSLDQKSDDYIRVRNMVLDRCRELEREREIVERDGDFEKANKIAAHISFVLQFVEMCDSTGVNF